MNNRGYFILGSILGAATGVVLTYIFVKKKYNKEFDEETNAIMEEIDKESEIGKREKTYKVDPETKEKLLKNWDKPPLSASFEDELAETEHPVDSDEEDDEDDDPDEKRALEVAVELEEEKRRVENDPPRVISEEEIGELSPGWDTRDWFYYINEGIMTDDDSNIIDDYKTFIGDILDESGFISDEEMDEVVILVGSYQTVYRINKVYGEFHEYIKAIGNYS